MSGTAREGPSAIELETRRLQQEVAALKKLQELKQQEEELTRWLQDHESDDECSDGGGKHSDDDSHDGVGGHSPSSVVHRLKSALPQEGGFFRSRMKRSVASEAPAADIESQPRCDRSYSKTPPKSRKRRFRGGPVSFLRWMHVSMKQTQTEIYTRLDAEDRMRGDGEIICPPDPRIVITLLKVAFRGGLIGLALVSLVLVVDNVFLLRFSPARAVRRATSAIINDSEALRSFEDDARLKFMEAETYTSLKEEVADENSKVKLAASKLERRAQKLSEIERETEQVQQGIQALTSKLGLDRWCGDCVWSVRGSGITCSKHVQTAVDEYHIPKFQAMMAVMSDGRCQHVEPGSAEARKQMKVAEQNVVQNWRQQHQNFCPDCEWDVGMSCLKRAQLLNERYSTPMVEAMAKAMVETEKCTNSYYEAKIAEMGGFCGECVWGKKASETCNARVEYLVYTYRNPEHVAKLAAMERPQCRGEIDQEIN